MMNDREPVRRIQHVERLPGRGDDAGKPPDGFAPEKRMGVPVAEAPDHAHTM